ncbi:hypothetical protein [Saccharopolyspora rectivirgula]|jgi:hypothetical protein|uniref:Uncharacterized protein n=1 Tax=Saccharopolyspora rectivirgula TaxID=28042 RepID=A0A073AUR4_9PSEU|nr:hypothetical protein [Saccharopolyspora rectivirgula]KEI43120.1 hypothetical protein GU90_18515 [Saccharopolyspora rectivirgula]
MLCPLFGRLTVWTWTLLPLLFLGSAMGVAAALDLLWHEHQEINHELVLSAQLLLGGSAALTLLTGQHVDWRLAKPWQLLRYGYPVVLFTTALCTDTVQLSMATSLAVGSVAAALLGVLLTRGHRNTAACA